MQMIGPYPLFRLALRVLRVTRHAVACPGRPCHQGDVGGATSYASHVPDKVGSAITTAPSHYLTYYVVIGR